MGYIDTYDRRQSWAEILIAYLRLDLLGWLLVAVVVGRICMILRYGVAPAPFWDGLAFGGMGWFFAYHYLGIFAKYYLAPLDLIAVLYVGRFTILSWNKMRYSFRVVASVLVLTVLLQNVSRLTFFVFSQKNVIHGKSEIARVIEARYRSYAGSALRLFFPFASPYVVSEFAAYLNYRGVPVEGGAGKSTGLNNVTLAMRTIAKDGLCFEGRTVRCHATNRPNPGDLVVVLPDDKVAFEETSAYEGQGKSLFSYQPFPTIPQWLPFVPNRLPIAGMHGSVTLWQ